MDETSVLCGRNRLGPHTKLSGSSLGYGTYIISGQVVNATVGKYCSIGQNVQIGSFGRHYIQWLGTHPSILDLGRQQLAAERLEGPKFAEHEPIRVESDVWIGSRASLLDGVKVGTGSVIAAGAMVTRDVEPYTIVGGIPAKQIRRRFPDSVAAKLLQSQWWDLSMAELSGFLRQVGGRKLNDLTVDDDFASRLVEYAKNLELAQDPNRLRGKVT